MQFVALLIGVALAVKYWWLIVGVVGVIAVGYWGRRVADAHAERVEAEQRRLAGLVARADQQHARVMQGDPRGIYGESISATTDHAWRLRRPRSARSRRPAPPHRPRPSSVRGPANTG